MRPQVHTVTGMLLVRCWEPPGRGHISVLYASSVIPTLFSFRTGRGPPCWTTSMMSFTPTRRLCWDWALKRTSLRMEAMEDSWSRLRYRPRSGLAWRMMGERQDARQELQGACGPAPRAQVPVWQGWQRMGTSGSMSGRSSQQHLWHPPHPSLIQIISSWPRSLRSRDGRGLGAGGEPVQTNCFLLCQDEELRAGKQERGHSFWGL